MCSFGWKITRGTMTKFLGSFLLILIVQSSITTASNAPYVVECPFAYRRHSLDDIREGTRPYLFGGIYNKERIDQCINCKRGGLWSAFCGFSGKGTGRDVPFWNHQLCNGSTIDAVIQRTLQHEQAESLLTMTPCDMWYYLRGRTTWIIGDSMSKDLFKALKCFMVEFTDLNTYHASSNFTAMHLLDSIPGYGEPHCMHMPQHTRLCQVHAIQGDLFIAGNRTKVGVIPLLQQSMAQPHDLFIVNFGLWHGETKQPEYLEALHQLGRYYTATKSKFPNLFWMETPKQHFDSADGDYKVAWIGKRKGPFQCQAVKGLSMNNNGSLSAEPNNAVAEYVLKGSWRNIMAREVLGLKYKMPIVPVYNVTATAWQFHRTNFDGQECSHYCHPSIPQLWLWTLKNSFKKYWVQPVQNWKELKHKRAGCASVLERDEAKLGAPKSVELVLKEQQQQQRQQQQRKQQQQQQQRKRHWLWSWLFGPQQPQVDLLDGVPQVDMLDGVPVVRLSGGSSSSVGGGGGGGDRGVDSSSSSSKVGLGPFSHSSTINPWQTLEKIMRQEPRQQQQHHRQAQSSQGGR